MTGPLNVGSWFININLDLIGVNLQLSYVDSTHFESIIRSHNYDATSFDFSVSSVPETNSLQSLFGSAYAFNSDNAASTGIVNPDLDRLIFALRPSGQFGGQD